jgi:nanoRNase/pAp phosphatase (c-di-AMP/oligoRNAs hydrolase)
MASISGRFSENNGERHVVVLRFPDPDAISSANAHRLISARFGIEVDILYSGEISHQQNIALVKLLGINVARFEPSMDFGAYQAAIFVDHQVLRLKRS